MDMRQPKHNSQRWQLSENKIVASVHVMASRNHDFMPVAAKIRKALHHRGIHSSTIQPEYHSRNGPPDDHLKVSLITASLVSYNLIAFVDIRRYQLFDPVSPRSDLHGRERLLS